jgi:hypothetical protein
MSADESQNRIMDGGELIQVHRHYILRNVHIPRNGPLYRQIAVIEESLDFTIQFYVKRWQGDDVHDYLTLGKEIQDMTLSMHPRLSSAVADADKEVEDATRSGEWEIRQEQ